MVGISSLLYNFQKTILARCFSVSSSYLIHAQSLKRLIVPRVSSPFLRLVSPSFSHFSACHALHIRSPCPRCCCRKRKKRPDRGSNPGLPHHEESSTPTAATLVFSAPVPSIELPWHHGSVVEARHDTLSPGAPHHKATY